MGEVGICSKQMGGGRYFSKELEYLTHQIQGMQSLKWGEVTYICIQLWGLGLMKQEDEWGRILREAEKWGSILGRRKKWGEYT